MSADFSPLSALLGGGLIGLATSILWLGLGRVCGISGIIGNFRLGNLGDRGWRVAFLAGLLTAPFLANAMCHHTMIHPPVTPVWSLIGGGFLVGFGTRLGGGCTSGHGVSGVARLSPRSIVATILFMSTAMATVSVLGWIGR